jgi:hypothetical protein
MDETNRFTDMFSRVLKEEPKSNTKTNSRKKIDFGANLASNPALIAAVKKLHASDDENSEHSSQRVQDSIPDAGTLEQSTKETTPEKRNSIASTDDSSQQLPSRSISDENESLTENHGPEMSGPNKSVMSPGMDNMKGHGTDASQDAMTHIGMPGPISVPMAGRFDDGTGRVTQPVTGPYTYPRTHPVTHPSVLTPKQRISNPVWLLSRQQSKILWHLINAGGLTKREDISICTGVPFGTVKNLISSLYRDGFISKPKPYTDRAFRGFSYDLNRQLCEQFMSERGDSVFNDNISEAGTHPVTHHNTRPVTYTDNHPVTRPVSGPLTNPVTHPENAHYSSSLETRSTTEDFDNLLKTDPELGYWQDKGLQPQQIKSWMEETRMSQALMLQSLKHCRFDMIDNNFEESKPVQNVFNWFYSIIRKTGHYPKPTGYLSWNEKMLQIEKALLEEQEAENRKMEELRIRKYTLEVDRKFQEMMNDPQGDTYKKVYERLSPLERELNEGMAFEKSMRRRFDEIINQPGS